MKPNHLLGDSNGADAAVLRGQIDGEGVLIDLSSMFGGIMWKSSDSPTSLRGSRGLDRDRLTHFYGSGETG